MPPPPPPEERTTEAARPIPEENGNHVTHDTQEGDDHSMPQVDQDEDTFGETCPVQCQDEPNFTLNQEGGEPTLDTTDISYKEKVDQSASTAPDLVAAICPDIVQVSTSVQERAKRLLVNGCMPLCPPARREWTSGMKIQIPIPGPLSVWPPNDWQLMSPDMKLLTYETVATLLHTCIYDRVPEDRHVVLDQFNFLALPGMRESKLLVPSQLMRYYNFTIIRKIASGEYKMTDGETIVTQFEAAATVNVLPRMFTLLLEAIKDIPLRI